MSRLGDRVAGPRRAAGADRRGRTGASGRRRVRHGADRRRVGPNAAGRSPVDRRGRGGRHAARRRSPRSGRSPRGGPLRGPRDSRDSRGWSTRACTRRPRTTLPVSLPATSSAIVAATSTIECVSRTSTLPTCEPGIPADDVTAATSSCARTPSRSPRFTNSAVMGAVCAAAAAGRTGRCCSSSRSAAAAISIPSNSASSGSIASTSRRTSLEVSTSRSEARSEASLPRARSVASMSATGLTVPPPSSARRLPSCDGCTMA